MESLLFAFNAVAPLIGLVVVGYILKCNGFINSSFAKTANKLVFRIFLPAMLFLNVYNIEAITNLNFNYIYYVIIVLVLIFVISVPIVMMVTKAPEKRGSLLQGIFRSNYALIGIPLAGSLYGEKGSAIATLLSAVVIPLLNVFAVISLTIFCEGNIQKSIKNIFLNILKNPLIQAIFFGLFVLMIRYLFDKNGIEFRLMDIKPLFKILNYFSSLATPMALIALGAQFEFSIVAKLKREILFGTVMRTLIVPLIGIGIAYFVFKNHFEGAHFATFIAFFATPVAVSSVPMAQEMKSDTALAGQLVVWTTIVSAFTIFIYSYLLKLLGIFN